LMTVILNSSWIRVICVIFAQHRKDNVYLCNTREEHKQEHTGQKS